jgi:hypothetical protein
MRAISVRGPVAILLKGACKVFGRLLRWLFRRKEKGVQCEWRGHTYEISIRGVTDPEEVSRRFAAYAPKAPVCVTCGRILLPGEPVSYLTPGLVISTAFPETITIEKEGPAHFTRECSPSPNFCGYVTEEGAVATPFTEDAPTAEAVAIRMGKGVIIGDVSDPRSIRTFDP